MVLAVALAALAPGASSAVPGIAESARAAIEYELPDPASLFAVPPRVVPVAVVADFNEAAADCEPTGLGRAIGMILRVEAWGLSPDVAFSHPTGYWADRRTREVDHQTPALRAAQRVGAERIIQGSVSIEAGTLSVEYEILGADEQRIGGSRTEGPAADAGALLAGILVDMFEALGAEIDDEGRARLGVLRAAGAAALDELASTLEKDCSGEPYAPAMERAWRVQPRSPTIAALYAGEVYGLHGADAGAPILRELGAAMPQHPVVALASSYHQLAVSRRQQDADALVRLKALAARYLHEPAAVHAFGDALASEELLWDTPEGEDGPIMMISGALPHPPGHAAAIALALRAAERWPGDYRAWWNVAHALVQYAWTIRGGAYWDDVPEAARRRFRPILRVADRAVHEAIRLHPHQSGLYRLQMHTDVAMHRAWQPSFEHGIRVDPHDESVYRAAFTYSRDGWGGNVWRRWRIYELARSNNPDAEWPARMYRNMAPEWEAFVMTRSYLLLALLALAAMALAWRKRGERP